MEMRNRLSSLLSALPPGQKVMALVALVMLAMSGVVFARWVTEPTYTVLYSGLDDTELAAVIDELEAQAVSYRIEGGGSRILVPQANLYRVRAALATAGVKGASVPQGYDLLDGQGINVSDFRQRIDYQRALEGELAKTLLAMDAITAANIHLVIPEEELFVERKKPATASVLIDTRRELSELEVETIAYLVASAVDGLEPTDVTVADVSGRILQAPGDPSDPGTMSSRQLRMVREFEEGLSDDIRQLLETTIGVGRSSAVVRAELDFDERSTESETFDPENASLVSEKTTEESFSGTGTSPGVAVGVDGGAVETGPGSEYSYERNEASRDFGVDRVVSRVVAAPGKITRLSVAVALDDGSLTGQTAPAPAEVKRLVAAAIGLDPSRGDSIEVSSIPFPVLDQASDQAEPESPGGGLLDLIPQAVGALLVLLAGGALFLMARGGGRTVGSASAMRPVAALPGSGTAQAPPSLVSAVESLVLAREESVDPLDAEVLELVERQPDEIAAVLRSWLADRRDRL